VFSVRGFVCEMGDDWSGEEGAEAVGCEHGRCYCLGVGWGESEAGFEHILQDWDEEAVEEFF
jgi:hypothetical protein